MELDERYKWIFTVKDAHDRDITLGIGVGDGRIITSVSGWYSATPEQTAQIGYAYQTVAYALQNPRPPQN